MKTIASCSPNNKVFCEDIYLYVYFLCLVIFNLCSVFSLLSYMLRCYSSINMFKTDILVLH